MLNLTKLYLSCEIRDYKQFETIFPYVYIRTNKFRCLLRTNNQSNNMKQCIFFDILYYIKINDRIRHYINCGTRDRFCCMSLGKSVSECIGGLGQSVLIEESSIRHETSSPNLHLRKIKSDLFRETIWLFFLN